MPESEIVYLNGKYLPKEKASLSILDRGFLFGDGVYELIPIYNKKIFYINDHLSRLRNSLDQINISPKLIDETNIEEIINHVIDKNNFINHYIYIHISRGVDENRNHIYTTECVPTILVMGENYKPFSLDIIKSGKKAITEEDYRWLRSNIKSTSLLANVLLKNKAARDHAYESLLIRDGYLTEGSASNVFIIKDSVIKTPRLSNKLLPGITRKFLTHLIESNELPFDECDITDKELLDADEIFCSSSTNPVVPIIQVNDKKICDEAGPMSMKLYNCAQDFIKENYS